MKSIAILALVAFTNAIPLGQLSGENNWYNPQTWGWSPAQQSAKRISDQLKQVQFQSFAQPKPIGWPDNKSSIFAKKTSQDVVENALEARQGQTIEGIQDLKRQMMEQQQRSAFGIGGQGVEQEIQKISTAEAIEKLQQQLQYQQAYAPKIRTGSQLAQTLETAIQAQLVSDSVEAQQQAQFGQTSRTNGLAGEVFRAKVRQLIDQCNIQEIQAEISRQQAKAQQLEEQQQFVNQQKQQIEGQMWAVGQNQAAVQLEQVKERLQQQEFQIVCQRLARQMVIQQLQQALVEQQRQLQQDTVAEQVGQVNAEYRQTQYVYPGVRNSFQYPLGSNEVKQYYQNWTPATGYYWIN